ncbi:MAG: hypothetical protein NTY08_06665 [Proteobacteria bacterium]|nr:hypothetical protein [Pseudomonadota bacterium]
MKNWILALFVVTSCLLANWTYAGTAKGKVVDKSIPSGEGLINSLLAPGPLMEGHKEFEHGGCLKCHDAGNGVPDNKCLECHTEIKKSIARKTGFHALAKGTCLSCHSDHKGRDFNAIAFKQKGFDHKKTGFALNGGHVGVECSKCHTERRTEKPVRRSDTHFFGQDSSCVSCHKKDDVHAFPPKWGARDCNACHSDKNWKEAFFDHKKETGYSLVGAHAKVSCAECHAPRGKSSVKYNFPELKREGCRTCHADFHKENLDGKFKGGACESCHGQQSWKIANFNHDITGFVLRGAHAKEPCVACHKQPQHVSKLKDFNFTGLGTQCSGCHKDYHGFRSEISPKQGMLAQCQTCHNEIAWMSSIKFNHNTDTKYPIDGKHIGVKCFECHKPLAGGSTPNTARDYSLPELEARTCETCHKSPHDAAKNPVFKTSKCSACHTTKGWNILPQTAGAGFNHSTMTRFPLTGNHVPLKCAECHLKGGKQIYRFPGEKTQFCEECHKTPHKEQFQPKYLQQACVECHNTTKFADIFKYDHNKTQFHLVDAHQKIGQQCVKCHTPTKRMLAVKPPHPAGKYIFGHQQEGYCVECHKNPHKDQFDPQTRSDNCQQCHNIKSFKDLNQFDHNTTQFKITGAHTKIKVDCVKCHIKTEKMLPVIPPRPAGKFMFDHQETGFCESCHSNVHKEQFSTRFASKPCVDCHVTDDFVKRKPFDHSQTDFHITGSHQKIKNDCGECHIKTQKNLPTKPPKPASLFQFEHQNTGFCEACHSNEHQDQFHAKFASQACRTCHSTVHFNAPIKFDHNQSRYDLKGKHLKVKCEECHKPTAKKFKEAPRHHKGTFIFAELQSKDCALCHADPHKGQYGKKCSQCHVETGWEKTSDFHKDFVLTGVHYILECNECHANKRQLTGTANDCKVCHQKDDAHLGSQPNCADCHTQQFWSAQRFQHSMTQFPLRGSHRLLECSECHANGVYLGRSADCASCHIQDAVKVVFPDHKLSGFEQCETCHNQFSFSGGKRR